jgi:cyclic-di-GMP-binding protein
VVRESSFDVVSTVDLQEVRNAVDQARREISQRFDFKNTGSEVDLEEEAGNPVIVVRANTEQKVKDCVKVLQEKLVRRKVALKALDAGDIQSAAGGTARQVLKINQGISTEKAREITKLVKSMKIKVQVAVQGEQVRISSRSKDALQEVMRTLREQDFGIPLQFTNYR